MYIHTYSHTYIHTYIHTYLHTYIHTYICAYQYIHTDRQTDRQTEVQIIAFSQKGFSTGLVLLGRFLILVTTNKHYERPASQTNLLGSVFIVCFCLQNGTTGPLGILLCWWVCYHSTCNGNWSSVSRCMKFVEKNKCLKAQVPCRLSLSCMQFLV